MNEIRRKRTDLFLKMAPVFVVSWAFVQVAITVCADHFLYRRGTSWHEFVPTWETCVGFLIGAPIGILVFIYVRSLLRGKAHPPVSST